MEYTTYRKPGFWSPPTIPGIHIQVQYENNLIN